MIRKIPKTVGYIIIYDDDSDPWSTKWAIEQAYGRNKRGEEGLFYLNASAADINRADNRVYYMSTVPGGYIESTDPNFYKYSFTYGDLLDICKGNGKVLKELLDLLIGQIPEDVYKEIRPKGQNRRQS